MKTARSKACDITQAVKKKVWERDEQKCIVCWSRNAMPNAHFIPRSHGGLGVEQNIVTLCQDCHRAYDQSHQRPTYQAYIRNYLKEKYGDEWSEDKLIYKKGEL